MQQHVPHRCSRPVHSCSSARTDAHGSGIVCSLKSRCRGSPAQVLPRHLAVAAALGDVNDGGRSSRQEQPCRRRAHPSECKPKERTRHRNTVPASRNFVGWCRRKQKQLMVDIRARKSAALPSRSAGGNGCSPRYRHRRLAASGAAAMDALLLRFEAESDQLGQQFPSDAVSSRPDGSSQTA